MRKVAIVGVEGSGKTVMLAGLGTLYASPNEEGFFLSPKNFSTAAYVAEKIDRMRRGMWPSATAGDEMEGLDWTLMRTMPGERRPKTICEVSFLDFAGEVYRTAFGIGVGDQSLAEQAEELKRYVREADDLLVLINLRDVIVHGIHDRRVQEAMWITKAILDAALVEEEGRKVPRAAIVLSQADSYAETIKDCGGAKGVLQKYLPYIANDYGWLDVFVASAVDKTVLDAEGNFVPAADFTPKGLQPLVEWIYGRDDNDVDFRLCFPEKQNGDNETKLVKKIAIVGMEASGKTVILAGLGDLYTYPDKNGFFLMPKDFETAAYVGEKILNMRKGDWPAATSSDEIVKLGWALKRTVSGMQRPETVCELSFLDFSGDVYAVAFGDPSYDFLHEQANELKGYLHEVDDLIVLINLSDIIVRGTREGYQKDAMWTTNSVLDMIFSEDTSRKIPRVAIVLSHSERYKNTIRTNGGVLGVLKKYLPYVASKYGWLDMFAVNEVETVMDVAEGYEKPMAGFTAKGLLPLMSWILGGQVLENGEVNDIDSILKSFPDAETISKAVKHSSPSVNANS